MLLNNQEITEEMKEEIKKYLETGYQLQEKICKKYKHMEAKQYTI